MNKNIIIVAVLVIAVLLLGGYFLFKLNNPSTVANQPENQNQAPQEPVDATGDVPQEPLPPVTHEVMYTNNGFTPSTITIKTGETVVFKNESSSGMWVGSAMHPSHTVYSGTSLQEHCPDIANTSFDQCASAQPGQSWSFTFNKAGSWGYHNHVGSSHFGKIIVE